MAQSTASQSIPNGRSAADGTSGEGAAWTQGGGKQWGMGGGKGKGDGGSRRAGEGTDAMKGCLCCGKECHLKKDCPMQHKEFRLCGKLENIAATCEAPPKRTDPKDKPSSFTAASAATNEFEAYI